MGGGVVLSWERCEGSEPKVGKGRVVGWEGGKGV